MSQELGFKKSSFSKTSYEASKSNTKLALGLCMIDIRLFVLIYAFPF